MAWVCAGPGVGGRSRAAREGGFVNPVSLLVPPVVRPGSLSSSAQPTLVAGDLTLRPWESKDVAVVRMAFADIAVRQWTLLSGSSDDDARAWINGWANSWQDETAIGWAVVPPSGVPVGHIALQSLNLPRGTGRTTCWLLESSRGFGWGHRARQRAARWAFDDLGLHRLALAHSTANKASCRSALKAGFAAEGVHRSAALHLDGWHDMHEHGCVQGDLPNVEPYQHGDVGPDS
ncbi:GNAT family N-acetyltransferase [Kitasatospora sp. LaBMicrA B282]|uniref:GNAT family N-acetyltransferase n=1 Tax=Kitasatospora sp. LaBMicrA B282 TaxID=3420949 RepID=UPI003D09AFD2